MTDILQSTTPFQSSPIAPELPLPLTSTQPIKSSYALPIIISSIVTAIILVGIYFLFINKGISNNTSNSTLESASVSPSPMVSTIDATSSWQTYTDPIEKVNFKHPAKYKIETQAKDDGSGFNYLFLPDNQITINIKTSYSDNQVKFYMDSPETGTKNIGEQVWSTYYLPQGYPDGAVGAGSPIYALQAVMDKKLVSVTLFDQTNITDELAQILATFKISSSTSSETILQTIETLTKPMVWTESVEGTLMDAAGDEIAGTLITSKVATKADNKFARYLATDTPFTKQYGWSEDPSGMAAGMGETISTYTKNDQKLIIRYKGGTYKVLLSK